MELMELKSKLVSWRGGGYSGCFWEPNLGFVDHDGNWHPSVSTGYNGIDTMEKLLQNADEDNELSLQLLDWSQESMDILCKTIRNDYVARLADDLNYYVRKSGVGKPFRMVCTECGRHFSDIGLSFQDTISTMIAEGYYRGDGGIGIVCSDIMCEECLAKVDCRTCGERYYPCEGQDDLYEWCEREMDWCPKCTDSKLEKAGDLRDRLEKALGDDEEMEKLKEELEDL